MLELSSSTSPMACTRRLFLETRVLSPRPVVPLSPVRVAICVSRLPMWGLLVVALHLLLLLRLPCLLHSADGAGVAFAETFAETFDENFNVSVVPITVIVAAIVAPARGSR